MHRFQAEDTISRPAEHIWVYAADILRHPEWMSVSDARVLRGHGTEVGARGRERLMLGPFAWDVEFEVAEAVPGRLLVWRTVDDPRFDIEVALELEPIGSSSTRARYRGGVEVHGRRRVLAPLIAMEGPAGVRRELRRLKEKVEAVAPPVAAN